MQVGILSQIKNPEQITRQALKILTAARDAGVRVFFSRHLSLPKELMGMFILCLPITPVGTIRSLESSGASERFCSPDCNDKMNPTAMRWRAHVTAIAVVLVCSIPHQSNGCSSGCIKMVVLSKCASRYVFAFSGGCRYPGAGSVFFGKTLQGKESNAATVLLLLTFYSDLVTSSLALIGGQRTLNPLFYPVKLILLTPC